MKWFETIKHGFPDPLGSCQAIKHKNYCFAPGSKFELCTKSTLPASLCASVEYICNQYQVVRSYKLYCDIF